MADLLVEINGMRKSRWITQSGPFDVKSCADGTLIVTPKWPQYSEWTELGGGGPGIFGRLGLAHAVEIYLNSPYPAEAVEFWTTKGAERRSDRKERSRRKWRRDATTRKNSTEFKEWIAKERDKRLKVPLPPCPACNGTGVECGKH